MATGSRACMAAQSGLCIFVVISASIQEKSTSKGILPLERQRRFVYLEEIYEVLGATHIELGTLPPNFLRLELVLFLLQHFCGAPGSGTVTSGVIKEGPSSQQPRTKSVTFGGNLSVPKGLQHLVNVEQLLVEQRIEPKEAESGIEYPNRYRISNKHGTKLYKAVERSTPFQRNCFGPSRALDLKLSDSLDKEDVATFRRPLRCSCCFPCLCCAQKLEGRAHAGYLLGSVEQVWSPLRTTFLVRDHFGAVQLKIVGPWCMSLRLGWDVVFEIINVSPDHKLIAKTDGEKIGKIVRRRMMADLLDDSSTGSSGDADNFGITFHKNLDVRMKAMILGATLLIDYAFYETRAKKPKNKKPADTSPELAQGKYQEAAAE